MTSKKHIAKTLSILELIKLFPDEQTAIEFYEQGRWNGKPACHVCDTPPTKKGKLNRYWCKPCRKWFTVRNGTVMESSRIPVQKWLLAIYMVLTARKGVSSLQLSQELGITQKSAWFMMHRIRESCRAGNKKLDGIVEIDEAYFGGKEARKQTSTPTRNCMLEQAAWVKPPSWDCANVVAR